MIGVAGWAAARKTQNCEAEAASGHTRKIPTFPRRLARQSHYPRCASRSFSAAEHATATGCERGRGLGAQLQADGARSRIGCSLAQVRVVAVVVASWLTSPGWKARFWSRGALRKPLVLAA